MPVANDELLRGSVSDFVGNGATEVVGGAHLGIAAVDVDALAGRAAHELFLNMDEHGGGLCGERRGSLSLAAAGGWGSSCGRGLTGRVTQLYQECRGCGEGSEKLGGFCLTSWARAREHHRRTIACSPQRPPPGPAA